MPAELRFSERRGRRVEPHFIAMWSTLQARLLRAFSCQKYFSFFFLLCIDIPQRFLLKYYGLPSAKHKRAIRTNLSVSSVVLDLIAFIPTCDNIFNIILYLCVVNHII